jgi:hypothetical protein
MRLLLALWLALFTVQSSGLVAAVSPDECVESSAGAADDVCPDDCARCVCCARVPLFVPHVLAPPAREQATPLPRVGVTDCPASAEPSGIFHVPKTR